MQQNNWIQWQRSLQGELFFVQFDTLLKSEMVFFGHFSSKSIKTRRLLTESFVLSPDLYIK